MSASSNPTEAPLWRSAAARLTATVDLPTPPLPDATAMVCFTPGRTSDGLGLMKAGLTLAVIRTSLALLQAACRMCTVCADQGIIPEANPTFSGEWGAPFFLVGQAPGAVERESRRPFSGRAGKELDRWMARAGFASAEEFRRLTYIAALMRCFPGQNVTGTGDLRPPPA